MLVPSEKISQKIAWDPWTCNVAAALDLKTEDPMCLINVFLILPDSGSVACNREENNTKFKFVFFLT